MAQGTASTCARERRRRSRVQARATATRARSATAAPAGTPTPCCTPPAAAQRQRAWAWQALGVAQGERGAIVVDEAFQTSVPGSTRIGDVIDRIQLTPVALAEAMVLVDRLFGSGQRAHRLRAASRPPCSPTRTSAPSG